MISPLWSGGGRKGRREWNTAASLLVLPAPIIASLTSASLYTLSTEKSLQNSFLSFLIILTLKSLSVLKIVIVTIFWLDPMC